jgi:hypothetical protein
MSRFSPLEFQKEAIQKLTDAFQKLWQRTEPQRHLVFKSPTGSGKTFMVTNFLHNLNSLPNWDYDKAIIWITFSDSLAMQSKEKFKENFDARKSSIYNNKPLFSIFGIGDYSFKPYKVAISGLYKTFHFTLILPQDNKPVMLDDTCYLIGFENVEYAVYSLILLNSDTTVQFLQTVTFADAKRTFTKDVLMRIDLLELGRMIDKDYLTNELIILNEKYNLNLSLELWDGFINEMTPIKESQMTLFG